jgi:hypothetical protein
MTDCTPAIWTSPTHLDSYVQRAEGFWKARNDVSRNLGAAANIAAQRR